MRLLNRIFRIAFSIYALSAFICTFIIIVPLYFIVFNFWNKKTSPHVAHRVSRFWAKMVTTLFFIQVEVENKDLIDKFQPYVMVCNHRSMIDIVVSAIACSNTFRFLAKAELTKVPVIGYVIKNLYVPVERRSKDNRHLSMELMGKSLQQDISVFIYPEGKRNTNTKFLLPFYDGAFRLAIDQQVPMAVLTILDAERLWPATRFLSLRPGKLRCVWHQPIHTLGMTEDDIPSLQAKVAGIMTRNLN